MTIFQVQVIFKRQIAQCHVYCIMYLQSTPLICMTFIYLYNSVEFVCLFVAALLRRFWTKYSLTLTDYGVSLGK